MNDYVIKAMCEDMIGRLSAMLDALSGGEYYLSETTKKELYDIYPKVCSLSRIRR